jgi:hypothetical protein
MNMGLHTRSFDIRKDVKHGDILGELYEPILLGTYWANGLDV